ncbi:MAG: DUF2799 domain-containing protein [Pseudomonadota bacterium]
MHAPNFGVIPFNLLKAFPLVVLFLLAGCATMSESECAQADWRIIGLEDGAKGRALSYLGNHRKACAEYGIKPDLAEYQVGHRNGVRQYCIPQTGFRQGRSGRTYHDVCPADLEGSFLAAYETGRELHRLENQIDQLAREIHDQEHDLEHLVEQQQDVETKLLSASLSTVERKRVLDQFKQLQSRVAILSDEIRRKELEMARKQGEFDLLERSHGY